MDGRTARAAYTCARTLTSHVFCHTSSGASTPDPVSTPALEQNRSIRPCSSRVVLTRRWTSASRVTSTPSRPRSDRTTAAAPSASKRVASARPIPPAAPVTTTTLSASFIASRPCQSAQHRAQRRHTAVVQFRCRQQRQYRRVHPAGHILLYLFTAPLRRAVQNQRVDHVVRNRGRRAAPVAGRPCGPHRTQRVTPTEPTVERRVGRHRQIARDHAPTQLTGVLLIVGRADEDTRDGVEAV